MSRRPVPIRVEIAASSPGSCPRPFPSVAATDSSLSHTAYSLRNSIEGDLKDKIEAGDKETLDKAISETVSWLDGSDAASKDEYEEKQKELEGVANPIMQKVYAAAGGAPGGMPGGAPGGAPPAGGAEEPSVEEID